MQTLYDLALKAAAREPLSYGELPKQLQQDISRWQTHVFENRSKFSKRAFLRNLREILNIKISQWSCYEDFEKEPVNFLDPFVQGSGFLLEQALNDPNRLYGAFVGSNPTWVDLWVAAEKIAIQQRPEEHFVIWDFFMRNLQTGNSILGFKPGQPFPLEGQQYKNVPVLQLVEKEKTRANQQSVLIQTMSKTEPFRCYFRQPFPFYPGERNEVPVIIIENNETSRAAASPKVIYARSLKQLVKKLTNENDKREFNLTFVKNIPSLPIIFAWVDDRPDDSDSD